MIFGIQLMQKRRSAFLKDIKLASHSRFDLAKFGVYVGSIRWGRATKCGFEFISSIFINTHVFDLLILPVAWVSSITMAVFLFLGPVMGAFVNRFGCRVAIAVGCLSCAVGLALGSLVPNIMLLYLAFSFPFGLGISFVYVSVPVTVTEYFNKRRSVALGCVTAGQGLGTMILGPTLQALLDAFDWRNTLLIMSGVLAFVSLTGCFVKGNDQDVTSSSTQAKKNSKNFSWNLSAWKSPKFLVLLVMAGITNFSRMIPYVHLVSVD